MNSLLPAQARRHLNVGAFVAAAVVVYLFALQNAAIFETAISVLTFSLIAIPLGLMYGHGGVISVCQAAFAAVGGYATAKLCVEHGWSPWVSLLFAIALPALVAFAISRRILRLPEFALALTTVALGQAWAIFAGLADPVTGGHIGIAGVPPLPIGMDPAQAFIGGAALVAVIIALYENFVRSARGRALNAIRTDPILASSLGVNVAAQRAVIFSIAAGVAGLGGWFYAHYVGFIAPDSLSFHQSTAILFMVVIGGRRSSLGPVIGAVIYIMASDHLPGADIQGAYFGAMLVAAILLLPDGVASLPDIVRRRTRGTPPPLSPTMQNAPSNQTIKEHSDA